MQILLICHDSPLDRSYGAGVRTNSIWQALAQVGEVSALVMEPSSHTVLDTTPREGEIGRIRFKKPAVPWTTPETRKIRRLVAQVAGQEQFDLIVVRYLRLAMLIQGSVSTPIVVDGDDLDKVASTINKSFLRRCADFLMAAARRGVTRIAVKRFAHVWYVNPRDQHAFPARSASVLPNVTHAPAQVLPRANSQPPRVVMVGKFGYEPNAEGAEFFMREVLPALRVAAPGTRFRLVGNCPTDLAARWRLVEGVDLAGFVDDLASEYAGATVVVAPVFSGGGTQIKVLEALGHGCGTVVSEFSAAGFLPTLRADLHMLVAGRADEWLTQCLRLIKSPGEAKRLGQAGRKAVLQDYSVDAMADEVRRTISRVYESVR